MNLEIIGRTLLLYLVMGIFFSIFSHFVMMYARGEEYYPLNWRYKLQVLSWMMLTYPALAVYGWILIFGEAKIKWQR